MSKQQFVCDLEAGFRNAMREGFVNLANAFAELLEDERRKDLSVGLTGYNFDEISAIATDLQCPRDRPITPKCPQPTSNCSEARLARLA